MITPKNIDGKIKNAELEIRLIEKYRPKMGYVKPKQGSAFIVNTALLKKWQIKLALLKKKRAKFVKQGKIK